MVGGVIADVITYSVPSNIMTAVLVALSSPPDRATIPDGVFFIIGAIGAVPTEAVTADVFVDSTTKRSGTPIASELVVIPGIDRTIAFAVPLTHVLVHHVCWAAN